MTAAGKTAGAMRAEHGELFELSLHGGAPEHYYRRLRPDVERLPWERLKIGRLNADESAAARHAWTDVTLQEYVGSEAHADLFRALVRARAPLDLCAMTARFPLDELAHAEISARVVELLGGGVPVPYRPHNLYRSRTVGAREPEIEAAEMAILNCCVAESWSAGILRELAAAAKDPAWRALRLLLAKDEAVHARPGWIYLDWLAPDLGPSEKKLLGQFATHGAKRVREAIARSAKLSEAYFSDVCPSGGFGRDGYVKLATDSLEKRVLRPFAARGIPVA
jgi:hypothetical protein